MVLTRKQQEKIRIGDGITITVLKMKGSAVRLGIEAPTEVSVVRGELKFRDQNPAQNQEAAFEADDPLAKLPTKARQPAVREANWSSDASAVLHRVPRSEVEKLRGPLRSMLDQRVGTSG